MVQVIQPHSFPVVRLFQLFQGLSVVPAASAAAGGRSDIKPVERPWKEAFGRYMPKENNMNSNTSNIKPDDVRTLRIYLGRNRDTLLNIYDISSISSPEIALYLAGAVPAFRNGHCGHDAHALAQDIAKVMRDDRALERLYEIGKANRNPSGRSFKVHRPGAEPKL